MDRAFVEKKLHSTEGFFDGNLSFSFFVSDIAFLPVNKEVEIEFRQIVINRCRTNQPLQCYPKYVICTHLTIWHIATKAFLDD